MREYKFRAKLIEDNKWHYGYIWIDFLNHAYIIERVDVETDYERECILETIGQYTNLKDKNGVEIYEGDKLNYHETKYDGNGRVAIVIWLSHKYMLQSENGYLSDIDTLKEYEVIGNVHEEAKQ